MKPRRILSVARLSFPLAAALAALFNLATPSAQAVTYYWDQNGTAAGFGAAGGTWNTTGSSTWNLDPLGGNAGTPAGIVSTSTATNDGENFGTATAGLTTGSINVGTVAAGNITFGAASGAITLTGGTITLGNSQIIVNNTTNTINSALGGTTNAWAKAGNGTIIIGTGSTTRTGTLTISAGTLQLGNAGTTGSFNSAMAITNNATLRFNRTDTLTQGAASNGTGAAIGGTGAVTQAGSGTVILSLANGYSGATNIQNGTLRLANTSAVASSSGIAMSTASNSLVLGTDTVFTTLPNITGSSGAFTYTIVSDRATLGAGLTHQVGSANFGNATFAFTAGGNVNSGTAGITFTGAPTLGGGGVGTVTFAPGTGAALILPSLLATNASKTLILGGTGTGSITGAISPGSVGITTVTKSNTSTWTLGGTNTYAGNTNITGGTLTLSGTGSINNSSGIAVNGSGAKFLQNSSVAASPTVTLTNGTLTGNGTVNTVNAANSVNAIISNNDGVAGASLNIGALTFSGAATVNTFSNSTTAPITTTTLASNVAGIVTINPTAASWANNTTYDLISYGGSIGGAGFGQFALGTVTGLGVRQSAGTLVDNVGSAITLTISGDAPKWTGALGNEWSTATLSAPKNWVLQTAATTTDFIATDDVLFDDTATTFAPDINVANVSPNSTTFNNSANNYTLSGTGGFGIASGSLTKTGTGTVNISSINTYTGATTINAGTIQMSGSGTLGTGSALTLGGGNLDLGTTSQTVGAVSITTPAASGDTISNGSLTGTSYAASNTTGNAIISANLLGTGGFTKSGAGTATLSGANTYTGATNVSGVLSLTGSLSNASLGNINVNAGGTLNVSGTLSGAVGTTVLNFSTTSTPSTVNVSSGANISNLRTITGSTGVGIYNQTGGSVTVGATATPTNDTNFLATTGYGYMNLSGGTYTVNSRFTVTNGAGHGVARVGGGAGSASLSAFDLLSIGRSANATGELTVLPNGAVSVGNGSVNILLGGAAASSKSFVNIVGGTFSSPTKAIQQGNGTASTGTLAMVNLGAGTLEIGANMLTNTNTTAGGTNRGYVNFTGGTLKMLNTGMTTVLPAINANGFSGGQANTIFGQVSNSTANLDGTGASTGITGQDFVGGLTVDTNGFATNTISVPLVAPSGGGVAQGNLSITGGSGYIAPPTVTFSNPTAVGSTPAAGYALVSGGQVTGIVITSPGSYASGDTVTVTFGGGGGTGAAVTSILGSSLTANTSGGLTKIGIGNLTLSGASTFTGGLRILAGSVTPTTSATALGAASSIVTLGDTTGSSNATLAVGTTALNFAQPIVVAFGSSGTKTITQGGAATTLSGGITLNDDLTINISGTANLNTSTAAITGSKDITINSSGSGIWVPQFQHTYNGTTHLVSGTAVANVDSTGSASTADLTSGPYGIGTLSFEGGSMRPTTGATGNTIGNAVSVAADITFTPNNNTTLTFNGPVTLTGTGTTRALTYAQAGGNIVFSGNIGDGGGANGITIGATTTGTFQFSGANTYSGATLVSGGTLALTGSGAVNSSSGITVSGSGAKLLQTSSVAISPTVTLTQGTLTGNGTVNTVNVGDNTGGIISNNNGVAGAALTIGSLTFNGGATVNTFSDSTAAPIVTTTLAANTGTGTVTINPTAASWANNATYNLISYGGGSIGGTGGFGQFTLGTVPNLTVRQTAGALVDSGTAITMTITGDTPYWVGDGDAKWNLASTNNWKLLTAATYTTFIAGDESLFDDNATGSTNVDIDTDNVAPNTTTFNNTTKNYTLGSTGGFGISTGNLTKTGTGTLTIGTANTYTGATAINAGTVTMSGSGTLGTGSALTLGGGNLDLGTSSQTVGAVSVTAAAASGDTIGNGSLTGTSYSASNTTGTAVISANLLGTGGFTKTGDGSVTLSGANTYAGTTLVSAGTLTLAGNRTVAPTATVGIDVGGAGIPLATLNIQADLAMGSSQFRTSATGPSIVNQTAGNLIFTGGTQFTIGTGVGFAADYNLSGGTITSAASTNRGLLIASNANTIGTFTISGTGELDLATNAAMLMLGRSDTAASGSTPTFNQTGGTATVGTLTMGGAANGSSGTNATLSLTGGSFTANAFTLLSRGNTNTSTITIGGTADVTLPNLPTVRGTGSTATLYLDGGTLKNSATGTFITGLTNAYIQDGGANFDTSLNSTTISQALLEDPGSTGGGLTKSGGNTLTLSGVNTYTGATTITTGTLQLGNGTTGNDGTIASTSGVTNDSALIFNRFGSSSAGYAISGTGTVTKLGAGTQTLTGINTYNGATTITAGTLQLGDGTTGNDGTIANTSGVTNDGTLVFNRFGTSSASYAISGTGAVTKLGAGIQTLSGLSATAASNYSGTTTIGEGTLAFTTTSPSLTGGLTFGASTGSTNTGTLDLTNASATFGGGMIVRTNSASSNVITIGSGRTLTLTDSTVTNAISVGSNTAGGVAKLQVTGSTGTLTVDDPTRNIVVANTDTNGTPGGASAQMDLSGLGTFNATIANLYVGRPTSVAGAAANGRPLDSLTLANSNNITASGNIVLGATNQSFAPAFGNLILGTTNILNAARFVVANSRTSGTMQFNTGLTTPSATIRGATGGTSRTDIFLGDQANITAAAAGTGGGSTAITGTMNFTGGSVDAMIGSLFVGYGSTTNGGTARGQGNGSFIVDGATSNVDVNTLVIAQSRATDTAATGSSTSTGTFTMKSGSLVVNTAMTLANDVDTTNTAGGIQGLTATFNLQGGTATIGSSGSPVNLTLGNKIATGNAGALTATVNLTGGTLNVFGDIQEGTQGNGTITSSLTLNGASAILDMKGKNITNVDIITYTDGTLRNLGTVNTGMTLAGSGSRVFDQGTGVNGEIQGAVTGSGIGLTKQGDGILTLSGVSTYTGDTLVNNGTLALTSTGGLKFVIGANDVNNQISGSGLGAVSLDGQFTFDLTGAGNAINDSWNIVDVANLTESFGTNFSITGFTADGGGDLWSFDNAGTIYNFSESSGLLTVIPEPSAAALLGALGTLLLLRRRR